MAITSILDLPPSPLFYVSDHKTGWEVMGVTYTTDAGEEFTIDHVVPCNDLRIHQLCWTCWCLPVVDPEAPFMANHNSADGRELYEQGVAKPN